MTPNPKASQSRLYKHVEFLTSLEPARNYLNAGSLEGAVKYISREFSDAGFKVEHQAWKASGNEYKNVISTYLPQKEKRLVLGAHYDVCGDQPGADDNASGVAGLLELARMIAVHQPPLEYGIDFVAYNLEEPPFFGTASMGSYVHAKSLSENKTDVIGMISLEMIGYFSDEPGSQPFPSAELARLYPQTANFIMVIGIEKYEAFNKKVFEKMQKDSAIDVQFISFASSESLANLSDQRNYWKFDYPALMIDDTSFVRNPNYHTKADSIDTLDFPKMTEVVNSTYRAITRML